MASDATLIGMDLGTFRTSIMASNGHRAELQTVVGWPKDHIARAVVGKEIVFGDEAIRRRTAVDLIRPFANGILKYNPHDQHGVPEGSLNQYKNAASALVRHAISLVRPEKGHPVFGVVGVPSQASTANKQVVMEATASAFDAVMLVPEPFTVAYSMNQLIDTLIVDIGAGTIDLCPMFGTFPDEADQITIPFGGDSIDEEFYKRVLADIENVRFSLQMARQLKEKFGFVGSPKERILATLPVRGRPTECDVTESLGESCVKIVAPIVEGIVGLISRYEPEIQKTLLGSIVLAGGGSQLHDLDRVIEQALEPYGGASVSKVYDSVFAGAAGALKVAMAMPPAHWQRIAEASGKRQEAGGEFRDRVTDFEPVSGRH